MRWRKALPLALGLSMSLAAVGGAQAAGPLSGTNPATTFVAVGLWNYLDGLNPLEAPNNSLTSWYQTMLTDPPLAIVSRMDKQDMIPVIASHWSYKGKTLSIWLNQKAKWSNGQPVTTADLVLSLQVALYIDQWEGLSAGAIKVVSPQEVQVTEGSLPDPYFVADVLGYTPVYPASEFAHFIPKNIYQIFLTSNGSSKAAVQAQTTLTNLTKTMEAYKPNYSLSCGPWVFQSNSAAEALFKPNPDFWGVKSDHIPELELLNGNNVNEMYAWADESAFTLGSVPNPTPPLAKQWLRASPYHSIVYSDNWGNVGIDFNTSFYPYNILKVRQAFAYLIDRTAVAEVANPLQAVPVSAPVAYFDYVNLDQWLTPAQQRALNPYGYDPAKGTALLKAAGFKKTAKGWLMPNGKPFVVQLYGENNNTSWEDACEVVKEDLGKVGITTDIYFPPPAVYSSKLAVKGSKGYPLAIGWEAFSVRPYNSIVDALDYTDGVNLDYGSHTWVTAPGDIGLIPMTLPNGKPINVAKVATAPTGLYGGTPAQIRNDVWVLSEAANYNMPALPLWGQNKNVNYVDSQYFKGIPTNPANPYWVVQNNLGPDWVAWFYQGLIKPTHNP